MAFILDWTFALMECPSENRMKMSLEERRAILKQEKERENAALASVGIAINMYHEALRLKKMLS